ncbi:hypothetical protein FSP39_018875 [Pinctada imbricata]|uniref:Uncharacterized protein n=1 Tax=Pinctada imbricata TaxID=66713 RepID=A0AA89BWV3_PINIB|nr:hypothetical protein FSP39_018875 [Pinctada imbricata]
MGLGKTIQAISIAYYYKSEWPLLIIVPSSLRFSWVEELEKWIPDIHPSSIFLVQSGNDASGIQNAQICITTFGLLCKSTSRVILEALNNQKFQVVIVDESHYIRNIKTASCKAIVPLIKNANRKILLSGTPSLSKPVELFPQIDAICPGKFGSWWSYTARYCDAKTEFIGKIRKRSVDGASNLEELQQKLSHTLMIRRCKDQVLTQLPPKQRQRVLFDLKDSDLKKEIKKLFEELKPFLKKRGHQLGNSEEGPGDLMVLSTIQKLYQLSGEAKIGPARDYVDMLCDNENLKFIVFAYHHAMMNGIQQTLMDKNVKFIRIDGETKPSERQMYVNQFQSDPETKVAILSILAAGVGLTFTKATLVVFAEMYWTPGVLIQCEDRAHRIGQSSCVSVHYLVAKDTMDEWVWSAVCKKTIVTTTTLNGRKQKMEAGSGDKYQVDILSNADAYVPSQEEGDTTQDYAAMFASQQPRDQTSILDFWGSGKKRKKSGNDSLSVNKKSRHDDIITLSDDDNVEISDVSSEDDAENKIQSLTRVKEKDHTEKTPHKPGTLTHLFSKKAVSDSKVYNVQKKRSKRSVVAIRDYDCHSDDDGDFRSDGNKGKACKRSRKKIEDVSKKSSEWSCQACTFINHMELPFCEICGTPKPKGKTGNSVCSSEMEINETQNSNAEDKENGKIASSEANSECILSGNDRVSSSCQNSSKYESVLNSSQMDCCDDLQGQTTPKIQNAENECRSSQESCSSKDWTVIDSDDEELPSLVHKKKSVRKSFQLSNLSAQDDSESSQNQSERCHSKKDESDSSSKHTDSISQSPCVEKGNNPTDKGDEEENCYKIIDDEDSDFEGSAERNGNPMRNLSTNKRDSDENCNGILDDEDSDFENQDNNSVRNSIKELNKETDLEEPGSVTPGGKVSKGPVYQQSDTLDPKDEMDYSSEDLAALFDDCMDNDNSTGKNQVSTEHVEQHSTRVVDLDKVPVYKMFNYCLSKYTGRVYLFDQEGESLDANFLPLDVDIGNQENLPDLLLHPSNLRLVQKFMREWNSLTETKRRLVMKSGQMFGSLLNAYDQIRSGKTPCIQRHRTKDQIANSALTKAENVNGSVRVISKPKYRGEENSVKHKEVDRDSVPTGGVVQAVNSDGIPLCLHCSKPYNNSLLQKSTIRNDNNAWVTRFCSQTCMDKYWIQTNPQYCRDQVYEAEKGICQICKFDAHSFYKKIRDTADPRKRADLIHLSKFSRLTPKQKEQMVKHPVAGHFWHVDHIKPVWEGGGQCDIDNFRTLCVICHQKVTAEQAKKRATVRKLDYVFFETSSTTPYQIRRIEELNKTPNGNVEAKVMCFYRRRDISSSLTLLADKHQNMLEDAEIESKVEDVTDKVKHQLKHRELFLSRQVETLPATHIRGKCIVTLLNETESLLSYLNKDDTFFYSLVYDPQQKTLLADKGEIRVGSRYQAEPPDNTIAEGEDDRKMEDLEELIWNPTSGLADRQIDQFLITSRSVGTFARALDCTSTVRQPSLHMSAAAASRDITLFHAMDTLHKNKYDMSKAVASLVPSGGPVLCRDEMEEWSASEANLFEEALDKYGKDFNDIRQDFLPWKSLKSIVEYYYMWKTTDRYVQQKRIKAAEAESKLKQVYIPNYNKPNPAAINGKMNGVDGQVSGRACESCYAAHSSQWYSWGPAHMQCRLCSSCWIYWKKYGGLKMPTRLDGERPAPTQRQERLAAQFNSMRMHRCTIANCGKEFRLKAHLARHLATAHGLVVRSGSPRPVMKTRAAFCLITTPLTRISRRLCRDILNPRRSARSPFIPINIAAIKQECQLRLAEMGNYVPNIKLRGKRTLDPVVAKLGINTKMEKPALLHKSENDHKKPEKIFFPAPAVTPQFKPRETSPHKINSGSPSIMMKRGYESQSNGIDGPAAKRPNMGVIRQIGSAMRSHVRGNLMNHNMNGRGRLPGMRGMRMHMINWIDAPDDVYFVATDATRKLRRQLTTQDFKRTARNPWRSVLAKPPMLGADGEVVVLD